VGNTANKGVQNTHRITDLDEPKQPLRTDWIGLSKV